MKKVRVSRVGKYRHTVQIKKNKPGYFWNKNGLCGYLMFLFGTKAGLHFIVKQEKTFQNTALLIILQNHKSLTKNVKNLPNSFLRATEFSALSSSQETNMDDVF